MEDASLNPEVLHTNITTLKDNVEAFNGKLLQQISGMDEYYTNTCNQIWRDFDSMVQSLKQRIQLLTSSLKLSTETVKRQAEKRVEKNNRCEKKLETLAYKLSELLSSSSTNGDSTSAYLDIESERKALEEKCEMDQTDNLNFVRVEYEPQFIDMYHKIPTTDIGNIYLTDDIECCAPLSIENTNNAAICETRQISNQYSPPKLVVQSQWETDGISWISGITVTDDDHVFLSDRWEMAVKEYSPDGKMLKCYELPNEPWDIGSVSTMTIFVMMPWDFQLALLEKSSDDNSFRVSKILDTDKRYVSVSRVGSLIMASDRHTNIDILCPEGNILRSITIPALGEGQYWYPHRVSPGISTNTFLLLNWDIQGLLCYSMEGILQFSHDLKWDGIENDASAVCIDKYGRIYMCDKCRLYTLSPEGLVNILLTFEKRLSEDPRMFICNKRDFLFLSCYENDNEFKIFKIC